MSVVSMLSRSAWASLASRTGVLPFLHHVRRPADGASRVHRNDLADHQVVEVHANGSQVPLHGRRLVAEHQLFDVRRDDDGLDELEPTPLAPLEEPADGLREAGVLVADVRREELDEPAGRPLAGVRDHAREPVEAEASQRSGGEGGERFLHTDPKTNES